MRPTIDEIRIEHNVGGGGWDIKEIRKHVNVHVRFADLSGDSSEYIVQSWTAVAFLVPYCTLFRG